MFWRIASVSKSPSSWNLSHTAYHVYVIRFAYMRTSFLGPFATVFFNCGLYLLVSSASVGIQATRPAGVFSRTYLGFDRNRYPGDPSLKLLRQTFSFSGYWLNAPPNETSNTWEGKREVLTSNGFGFLVLFNGRSDRELKAMADPRVLGRNDAAVAVRAAMKEGFSSGTVIFLDQEEGGRMLPEQRGYVHAWIGAVNASGYRAGVYCSGIPANEEGGTTIITANDLRDNSDRRKIVFFIYNDSCPPSPGCAFPKNPPSPQQSGVPFAAIWQFAQSPRRREITASCPSNYHADGNCNAPLLQSAGGVNIDLDSAYSPDPSSGRP
jgi:hypothetical protein